MLHKPTIGFLKKLKKNNNREWFNTNKNLYEDSKKDFCFFIGEVIDRISEFDSAVSGLQPEKCVFRTYRDVRFSKDKKPYKTNMGASMNPGGRKSNVAGYYFHLEPGSCFLAGGKWMPEPDELKIIRTAIMNNPRRFKNIASNKDFKKYFDDVHGEKLKTSPKGFPKEHEAIEYLKLKSFIAYSEIKGDKKILGKNFPDQAAKVFKAMKPLIDFLREATHRP